MALQAFRYLLIASLMYLAGTASVFGANVFWDAAVSGDWDDPTKWTGGAVPAPGDDVFIDVAGTYTVTLDHANVDINSLTVGAASGTQTLALSFRTLTLDADSEIGANGKLQMRSATINGSGTLDLKGQTRITQTCRIFNSTVNFAAARFLIEGSTLGNADFRIEGDFENRGSILLTNSDGGLGRSALLTVRPDEFFVNATGATISMVEGALGSVREINVESAAEIRNFGTINIAQNTTFDPSVNAEIDNRGTLNVTGANVSFEQNSSSELINSGTINIAAGRTATVSSGRVVHEGGNYDGDGMLSLNFATVNGTGTFDPDVDCNFRAVTFNVAVENTSLMNLNSTVTFTQALNNTATGVLQILGSNVGNAVLRTLNRVDNRGIMRMTNIDGANQRTVNILLNNATAHFVNVTGAIIQIVNGAQSGPRNLISNSGSLFQNFAEINGDADYTIDNNGSSDFLQNGTFNVTSSNIEVRNESQSEFFNNGAIKVSAGQSIAVFGGDFVQQGGTVEGLGSASYEFVDLRGSTEFVNELESRFRSCIFFIDFRNQSLAIIRGVGRFNEMFLNEVNARLIVQGSGVGNAELRIDDRGINRGFLALDNNDNNLRLGRISVQIGDRFTNATNATIEIRTGLGGGQRDFLVESNGLFSNFGQVVNNAQYTIDLNNGVFDNNENIVLTNATVVVEQSGLNAQFTNAGVIAVATGLTLSFNNGALGSDGGRIEGGGLLSLEFADLEGDKFITNILTNLRSSDVEVEYENRLTTNLFGTCTFNKKLVNATGATLNITASQQAGSALARLNKRTENFGLIRVTNTHPTQSLNSSIQINLPGSVFVNATGASIQFLNGASGGVRQLTIENGKILSNFGAIVSDKDAIIDNNNGLFANHGLLHASGGNIEIPQSGINARTSNFGQLNISPGQMLEIGSGAFESGGGTTQGGGELRLEFTTLDGANPLVLETPTRVRSTTIEVPVINKSIYRVIANNTFEETFENATGATLKVEASDDGSSARMIAESPVTNFGMIELLNSRNDLRNAELDVEQELINTTNATIKFLLGAASGLRQITIFNGAKLLNFGLIDASTAATILNQSGLFVQQGGVQVSGGTLTLDQALNNSVSRLGGQTDLSTTGILLFDNGDVRLQDPQLSGGGRLEFVDAEILGTQTFNNPIHTRIRESNISNPIENSGLLEFRGIVNCADFVENASSATMSVVGTLADVSADLSLQEGGLNRGLLIFDNFNPNVAIVSEIVVADNKEFVNATNALMSIRATEPGTALITLSSSGTFRSFGDISLSTGGDFSTFGGNDSRVFIGTSGNIGLQGTLRGNGQIDFDSNGLVDFHGSIAPGNSPGSLSYEGTYANRNAEGIVEIELGGTVAGAEHDQFNVTGTARFSGILDIKLINGFVPQLGDEFIIMTYSNRVGEFDEVRGLDLGNGESLTLDYRDKRLVLFLSNETIVNVDVYMNGLWNGTTHKRSAAIVELREGADLITSELTDRTSALIDTDGRIQAGFESIQTGDYWVIVRHGGNFSVASKVRQSLTQGNIHNVDLRNADDVFNGDNAMFTIQLNGTDFDVVRTGDFNADQSASADDFIQFFIPNFGVVNPGQVPNLD